MRLLSGTRSVTKRAAGQRRARNVTSTPQPNQDELQELRRQRDEKELLHRDGLQHPDQLTRKKATTHEIARGR
jgi:hypothetical protein